MSEKNIKNIWKYMKICSNEYTCKNSFITLILNTKIDYK